MFFLPTFLLYFFHSLQFITSDTYSTFCLWLKRPKANCPTFSRQQGKVVVFNVCERKMLVLLGQVRVNPHICCEVLCGYFHWFSCFYVLISESWVNYGSVFHVGKEKAICAGLFLNAGHVHSHKRFLVNVLQLTKLLWSFQHFDDLWITQWLDDFLCISCVEHLSSKRH